MSNTRLAAQLPTKEAQTLKKVAKDHNIPVMIFAGLILRQALDDYKNGDLSIEIAKINKRKK